MDCILPGSSVYGIILARILERVAISFPRESSQPRDQTCISPGSYIGRWVLHHWPPGKPQIRPHDWQLVSYMIFYWCTGTTQRDGMGREEGGGFRMGNTCIPVADSFWYLAKIIQLCKVKKKKKDLMRPKFLKRGQGCVLLFGSPNSHEKFHYRIWVMEWRGEGNTGWDKAYICVREQGRNVSSLSMHWEMYHWALSMKQALLGPTYKSLSFLLRGRLET